MTAVEKRNLILKEVIIPSFKQAGFKKTGLNWWIELQDCYLIIRMRNSQFNGSYTGINFWFQFSATAKDELQGKLTDQWVYNQFSAIEEYYFLPQYGLLHPFREGLSGYVIDGYKNYEAQDMPVEPILEQIRQDMERCIVPELLTIHTLSDWNILKTAKSNRRNEKEICLLLYFSQAHTLSCSLDNRPQLLEIQKSLNLTNEDIKANMCWLKKIAKKSPWPELDSWNYVLDSTLTQ